MAEASNELAVLKKEHDDISERIESATSKEELAMLKAQFSERLDHLAARIDALTPKSGPA